MFIAVGEWEVAPAERKGGGGGGGGGRRRMDRVGEIAERRGIGPVL